MTDREAQAVKKIGRGFKSVLAGIGQGILAIGEAQIQRDNELAELQEAVDAFNQKWHSMGGDRALVLAPRSATEAPVPVNINPRPKKCTINTGFWDCEDPNCIYHRSEKDERGIGTPTINFK